MKRMFCVLALVAIAAAGCDKKATDATPAKVESTEAAAKPKHVDTNREAFKAAGRAAKEIENKGEDRNKAADDAMKAGQ